MKCIIQAQYNIHPNTPTDCGGVQVQLDILNEGPGTETSQWLK